MLVCGTWQSLQVAMFLCELCGYSAVISDAGPTVLVLADMAPQIRLALERHGWTVLSPGIDLAGARLLPTD